LLVGGSYTNAAFLKENLVNRIIVTVEPKLFASGKPLIVGELLDINLQLKQGKRLNTKGTLLLTYDIVKA
jgi:riboflavin biosynthesis pyrimidine reductase